MSKKALVITSISAPNEALRLFAQGCVQRGYNFILMGDKPSPANFELEGCEFYSLERQRQLPFALSALLPERHYGRKNLGYLEAIRLGAEQIVESDDDNFPTDAFWEEREVTQTARVLQHTGWVNVYRYYTEVGLWPRGLPLERLQDPLPSLPVHPQEVHAPIQQGLCDANPDVDAIYRLTGKLPVNFGRLSHAISLGERAACPFNSQNTTWFYEAFPLLYLPSFCSFRMTDIWRSYVAVRIARENGWHIVFHNANVWQERNEHNLMRDFEDEIIGYRNNLAVMENLDKLNLKPGADAIAQNMTACYQVFVDMGLIKAQELPLIEAWSADIEKLMRR